MARYTEQAYSVEAALENIGEFFWECYKEDLKTYAANPTRTDIVEKIHKEWDQNGLSPYGTTIRIEWAVAIYQHGDWAKAENADVPAPAAKPKAEDFRKKYPAEFRCDNGVYVRSLSELLIANWFYANRIVFEYEREVRFSSCGRVAHCDFYLPDYDVYVEFWGMESDSRYQEYKKWKEKEYAKSKLKLISLNYEDLKTLRDSLNREMKNMKRK